jgi:CysZ protein
VIAGVRIFLDGAGIAHDRRLVRYTWIPALIALVVISVGLTFAFSYLTDLSRFLIALLPEWLDFLGMVLTPLLYLLGLLIGAWLLGLLAVLAASPFLGDLSIAVERLKYPDAPAHPPDFWPGVGIALKREARKLRYHLPRLLGVCIITLIPLLNALSPFIWFFFGAWTMAVQFADYPAENRGLPFTDTLAHLRRNRALALGFGGCATLALAIPVLNFLLIPVAVAGGTLLWHTIQPTKDQPETA